MMSLPTRGAWIEINPVRIWLSTTASLPTRGAWIEIVQSEIAGGTRISRSPHGERGLKYPHPFRDALQSKVAPHTGSVD